MKIQCLKCKAKLAVPDEKASNPRLKLKCPKCGLVFPLAKAPRVKAVATASPQSQAPRPVPPSGYGTAAAGAAAGGAAATHGPAAPAAPATAQPEPVPGPVGGADAAHLPLPGPLDGADAAHLPLPGPLDGAGEAQMQAQGPATAEQSPAAADEAPAAVGAAAAATPVQALDSDAYMRCINHPETPSERTCPACLTGYCRQCGNQVQRATICTACETLCVPTREIADRQARTRRRSKPMFSELNTILRYPFSDVPALVMLTLVVGVFSFMGAVPNPFAPIAKLLARGLLMAYAFQAVERVSDGDLELSIPTITDVMDIIRVLLLSLAAILVSWGPFLYFTFSASASLLAAAFGSDGISGAVGAQILFKLLLAGIALLWALAYSPVALAVAALSHSFLETLKPWVGIKTIQRMGTVYWQALAIYVGFMVAQGVLSIVFGFVPYVGWIVPATTQAYFWLAVGCTMGLAVDKKAEALGLD